MMNTFVSTVGSRPPGTLQSIPGSGKYSPIILSAGALGQGTDPYMLAIEKRRIRARMAWAVKAETAMWEFFYRTGPAAGLTVREGQIDMAEEVLKAISEEHHLVAEAGVGIGKSYGYLVPILLFHKESGMPVVIATSTIALQEQLASDTKKLLPMLGMNEAITVAKGQTNYLCRRREEKWHAKNKTEEDEAIHSAAFKGCCDRRDFPMEIPDQTWKKICINCYSKKECCGCQYSSICKYRRMRETVQCNGIVICNQDMLTVHLLHMEELSRPILNPNIGILVVDEAHNLESRVRSIDTKQISPAGIKHLVSDVVNSLKNRDIGYYDTHRLDVDSAADALEENMKRQVYNQRKNDNYSRDSERYFFSDDDGAFQLFADLSEAVQKAARYYTDADKKGGRREVSPEISKLSALGNDMKEITGRSMRFYLFWIEMGTAGPVLCYCSNDIPQIIRRLYFSQGIVTILTSATMMGRADGTLEEQYSYFIRNTGFTGFTGLPMEKEDEAILPGKLMPSVPSPFPYDRNAMIYYASDLPHPTREHDAFIAAGTERLIDLLDISEGRALVLFTAKSDMLAVTEELKKRDTGYSVLVQKPGASQAGILKRFKEDEHAVLLGTGAFWEGISIEGRTLSNVVIFRLPFPVPDPITQSREEGVSDPLMDVRVPEMIIKLKQGVGRLIRNETDKGIISILDSRLREDSTVPYKDMVWNALPIKNRTDSLDTIRDFYNTTVLGS